MDVEVLYTNIDHSDGLRVVSRYLSDREGLTHPTGFIVELTKWVLNNNEFLFQDRLFRQYKGNSMGASFAPEYACLYLGHWESEYVFNPARNHFSDNINMIY